jgi:hypothetical protein
MNGPSLKLVFLPKECSYFRMEIKYCELTAERKKSKRP